MKAKPMNRNTLAFHATLLSLPPNELSSPLRCALLTKLTMRRPRMLQIPGIQSTKETRITTSYGASLGGFVCALRIAASKKNQLATANYERYISDSATDRNHGAPLGNIRVWRGKQGNKVPRDSQLHRQHILQQHPCSSFAGCQRGSCTRW